MIVTMDELEKGKWCPDARAKLESARDYAATNRINDLQNKSVKAGSVVAARCIGPKCMAWRWVKIDFSGYCGRAGEPTARSTVFNDTPVEKKNKN